MEKYGKCQIGQFQHKSRIYGTNWGNMENAKLAHFGSKSAYMEKILD